jgi:hypothetical protein
MKIRCEHVRRADGTPYSHGGPAGRFDTWCVRASAGTETEGAWATQARY